MTSSFLFEAPMYYRNAHGAIAVYDISSNESFNELKSWVDGTIN